MKRLNSIIVFALSVILSSVLVFTITRMMPLSPEKMLLSTYNLPQTPENVNTLTNKWGLDKPLYIQYLNWIGGMVHGDWGTSLISGISIREEFIKRLPYSIALGFGGLLLSIIIGFWLGYFAALKGGLFDLLSRCLSLLSQSVPLFISSLFIIYIIGVRFKLVKFFTGNPWISTGIGIVLIALISCGSLSRIARQHFIEVSDKTYLKRLYINGFKRSRLLLKHGYKPVIYAMSGAVVSRFASILGGSSVLEFAFAIPGINFFLIESIKNRDYYVIQTYLMLIMLWMALVQLVFAYIKNNLDVRRYE